MNIKLFFNIIFVILGSFGLLILGGIVTNNVLKDARFVQNSGTPATAAVSPKSSTKASPEPTDATRTIKFQRSPGSDEDDSSSVKTPAKTSKSPKPTSSTGKIRVEVINYSGIKNLAEQIRSTLEASGFEVSAGNGSSSGVVRSEIIERNEKKAGKEVYNVLKLGRIRKDTETESKFDVTVIIGDDYRP